jgi:DNA-binding IclR family transcriptional regulator
MSLPPRRSMRSGRRRRGSRQAPAGPGRFGTDWDGRDEGCKPCAAVSNGSNVRRLAMTISKANYPIDSVSRTARLLMMFRTRPAVRVADVASVLSVAPSTAHRMLTTLEDLELLMQDEISKAYLPGRALIDIGVAVIRATDVREEARSELAFLVQQTGETAHLLILENSEIIFIDGLESPQAIRAGLRTGHRAPAHAAAAGKALLAELDRAELRRRYPHAHLVGGTDRAIGSRSTLEQELDDVRRRAFATNYSESEEDLHAISVAVKDTRGRARAALSVSAPARRLPPSQAEEIAAVLHSAADRLGKRLL